MIICLVSFAYLLTFFLHFCHSSPCLLPSAIPLLYSSLSSTLLWIFGLCELMVMFYAHLHKTGCSFLLPNDLPHLHICCHLINTLRRFFGSKSIVIYNTANTSIQTCIHRSITVGKKYITITLTGQISFLSLQRKQIRKLDIVCVRDPSYPATLGLLCLRSYFKVVFHAPQSFKIKKSYTTDHKTNF